ncbi:MAG TPA: DUF2079 domain-containing protein [Thermoplasmata archaeon]|nr:DUF2079 domain-containing protein [Thermoplasmata archaeon]
MSFLSSNLDLGLYQQALWSETHGHGFFESADYAGDGALSFQRVNQSFLLYPLAWGYGSAPSAVTLFVLQSIAVAAAAVPLYLIARDAAESHRRGLLAAGLYLVWAPLLAANLFDFHLEAFLPLELFFLFWLWNRASYAWGSLAAVAAVTTFEAGAVFAFLIGLYFAVPSAAEASPAPPPRSREASEGAGRPSVSLRRSNRVVAWLRTRRTVAALGLMVGSAIAYLGLLAYQSTFGTVDGAGAPAVLAVFGSGPAQLGLNLSELSSGLVGKVSYWLIVMALVGFVPLLAPRTFLISAPWIGATFLSGTKFTSFGNQYAFLTAIPLFVGVALGVARAPTAGSGPSRDTSSVTPSSALRRTWQRWRGRPRWHLVVLGVIAVNLVMSPIDPLADNAGPGPGYNVSFSASPGYSDLTRLLGLVPSESSLVASDDLFPYVANDVNAFALPAIPYPLFFFPYNSTHPPDYVLLSQRELTDVPLWLYSLLDASGTFGLRGAVGQTPAGTALLFERGYAGSPIVLGPATTTPNTYWFPDVRAGLAGEYVVDAPVHFPYVIQSQPGATGNVWFGPYVGLPTGRYTATVLVKLTAAGSTSLPAGPMPVLQVQALGFTHPLLANYSWEIRQLALGGWTQLWLNFTMPSPTLNVEVRGYLDSAAVRLELGALRIAPG